MACMSACFLQCMVSLMQCKHTYKHIRYHAEKCPWPMALSRSGYESVGLPVTVDPGERGCATRTGASLPIVQPGMPYLSSRSFVLSEMDSRAGLERGGW